MVESYWVGTLITVAALTVGHWLPWPKPLERPLAYLYGLAAILVGTACWLGVSQRWYEFLIILAFMIPGAASGIGWPQKWPPLPVYVCGLTTVLAGLGIWAILEQNLQLWAYFALLVVCGGIVTLATYAYDVWRNHEILRQHDEADSEV